MTADNKDIVGECCRWMRNTLTAYRNSPFGFHEGLIEVGLGSTGPTDDLIFKSVLYCPFCGTKIPYSVREAGVLQ